FERNVNEGDIGPRLDDSGDRLDRIFCFSANDEVILSVYEITESLANERMIIHYEDTTLACDRFRKLGTHPVRPKSLRLEMFDLARRNRPPVAISPNIERRTAQYCTMSHQMQPESFRSRLVRKSDSIVDDCEAEFGAIHCEPNINPLGSGMFDRVCHRLLGDAIELVRNGRIVDPNSLVA